MKKKTVKYWIFYTLLGMIAIALSPIILSAVVIAGYFVNDDENEKQDRQDTLIRLKYQRHDDIKQ